VESQYRFLRRRVNHRGGRRLQTNRFPFAINYKVSSAAPVSLSRDVKPRGERSGGCRVLGGQFRPNFDVRETPSGRKILNEQRSVCESLLARAREQSRTVGG